jgi:hypothetical protein
MALIHTDIRFVAIVSNVKGLKINHRPVSFMFDLCVRNRRQLGPVSHRMCSTLMRGDR